MTDTRTINPAALAQPVRQALADAHEALSQKNAQKAQAAYKQAASAAPEDPTVPFLMAGILRQAGQHMSALGLFLTAWRMAPQDPNARQALVASFRGARFSEAAPAVVQALLSLLLASDVNAQDLAAPGYSLLQREGAMEKLLAAATTPEGVAQFLEQPEQLEATDGLFAQPLARALLSRTILADSGAERVFTQIRRRLLEIAELGERLPLSHGSVATLALQAEMCGYAWAAAPEEVAAVAALEPGDAWDDARLVRALYGRPTIHDMPPEEPLAGGPDGGPLTLLHQRLFQEPQREAQIAQSLPQVSPAADDAADARLFPRWRSLAQQPPRPLPAILAEIMPHHPQQDWPSPTAPRILVVGSGTGASAVRAAGRYAGGQVLALDESVAALAYARRQAEAMGVEMPSFARGSLPALPEPQSLPDPSGPFDVIECQTVLHRLNDPLAGLTALRRQLAAGGLLRLGFYRTRARDAIAGVRDYLIGEGYTLVPESLRSARQAILGLPESDPRRAIALGVDFYHLEGFADLLERAGMRAFTLPEVSTLLDEAGLEFLGFELANRGLLEAFRQQHAEPGALQDLSLWAAFEEQQPRLFQQSYQLWARVRAG